MMALEKICKKRLLFLKKSAKGLWSLKK